MANTKGTTRAALRASVSKQGSDTIDCKAVRDIARKIEAARDSIQTERFNIEHATELLELLGENASCPAGGISEPARSNAGLIVEYMARLIRRHVDDLGAHLEVIEHGVMNLGSLGREGE